MLKLDCTNQASGITYGQKSTLYIYLEKFMHRYMCIYIYTLHKLVVYIYILISLVMDMNAHTCSYIYRHIYMSKWDGFCNATW